MDNIKEVNSDRIKAIKNIEKNKARVARYYDKKVQAKSLNKGDLVWKVTISIRSKDNFYGK